MRLPWRGGGRDPTREAVSAERREGGRAAAREDIVAAETAVALVYNGTPHAVMMATPADLEDFAVGFTLSEGIVRRHEELYRVVSRPVTDGVELAIELDPVRHRDLDRRRRNLAGRVGCGLCGAQTIAQAIRHPAAVPRTLRLAADAVPRAIAALPALQPLNLATGAVHAAGWMNPAGGIELVREDVGRHNALDKLIGAMTAAGRDFGGGAVVITSRASHEMVLKAATVGIQAVVAMSAPTTLAIRFAGQTGVTLIAFARGDRYSVYAGADRVAAAEDSVPA